MTRAHTFSEKSLFCNNFKVSTPRKCPVKAEFHFRPVFSLFPSLFSSLSFRLLRTLSLFIPSISFSLFISVLLNSSLSLELFLSASFSSLYVFVLLFIFFFLSGHHFFFLIPLFLALSYVSVCHYVFLLSHFISRVPFTLNDSLSSCFSLSKPTHISFNLSFLCLLICPLFLVSHFY